MNPTGSGSATPRNTTSNSLEPCLSEEGAFHVLASTGNPANQRLFGRGTAGMWGGQPPSYGIQPQRKIRIFRGWDVRGSTSYRYVVQPLRFQTASTSSIYPNSWSHVCSIPRQGWRRSCCVYIATQQAT